MKTKNLIKLVAVVALTLFSASSFADNVVVKSPEINGKIIVTTSQLNLTDWQAVMSCHFDYKGSRKESIRYPQTILKKLSGKTDEYSLFIKKGSLSEFLPGWRLLTCAYKLILIGKNIELNNRTIMGEIYLLGQEHGEMDPEELKDMQNKTFVAKALEDKTRELKLTIDAGGIVAE